MALHLDHARGRVRAVAGLDDLPDPPRRPPDGGRHASSSTASSRCPTRRSRRPQATGLAFAKSGNLYVSLLGPNQVAVLDPAGNEIRRISDPRFFSPWGLAFMGNKLLVTNGDLEPGDHPDAWKIFKVDVGETGLPLIRPRVPVN